MNNKLYDNTLLFQPILESNTSNAPHKISFISDISLYIHIPFCQKKCFYCSIKTCQSYSDKMIQSYVDAVVIEIENSKEILLKSNINCVHFGGGTPSILSAMNLEKILLTLKKYVKNLSEKEIVFEANPMSINIDKVLLIAAYAKLSLNIGIQTFDTTVLEHINRHTDKIKLNSLFAELEKIRLYTLGIDLICNLPLAKQNTTINDIDIALEYGVNHFAIYPLRIEMNTVLYKKFSITHSEMTVLSQQIITYENAINLLISKNYEQYSIFHLNGTGHINHIYSRRQLIGGEWIGVGASAISYYENQIHTNMSDVDKYIQNQNIGISCIQTSKLLNITEIIIREILFFLRRGKMSKKYLIDRYGDYIYLAIYELFIKLKKIGYIQENEQDIFLTIQGIFNLSKIERLLLDYITPHSTK